MLLHTSSSKNIVYISYLMSKSHLPCLFLHCWFFQQIRSILPDNNVLSSSWWKKMLVSSSFFLCYRRHFLVSLLPSSFHLVKFLFYFNRCAAQILSFSFFVYRISSGVVSILSFPLCSFHLFTTTKVHWFHSFVKKQLSLPLLFLFCFSPVPS